MNRLPPELISQIFLDLLKVAPESVLPLSQTCRRLHSIYNLNRRHLLPHLLPAYAREDSLEVTCYYTLLEPYFKQSPSTEVDMGFIFIKGAFNTWINSPELTAKMMSNYVHLKTISRRLGDDNLKSYWSDECRCDWFDDGFLATLTCVLLGLRVHKGGLRLRYQHYVLDRLQRKLNFLRMNVFTHGYENFIESPCHKRFQGAFLRYMGVRQDEEMEGWRKWVAWGERLFRQGFGASRADDSELVRVELLRIWNDGELEELARVVEEEHSRKESLKANASLHR